MCLASYELAINLIFLGDYILGWTGIALLSLIGQTNEFADESLMPDDLLFKGLHWTPRWCSLHQLRRARRSRARSASKMWAIAFSPMAPAPGPSTADWPEPPGVWLSSGLRAMFMLLLMGLFGEASHSRLLVPRLWLQELLLPSSTRSQLQCD